MARMLGKTGKFPCGCCRENTKVGDKRANRRRERVILRREVARDR